MLPIFMRHTYVNYIIAQVLVLLATLPSLAQTTSRAQHIYHSGTLAPNIRTLRVQYAPEYRTEASAEALQRPVLALGSNMLDDGEVLEISFDELSHATHLYSYTLLHLDAQWQQSGLQPQEYIQGFNSLDITDYEQSFGTQQLYTHYRFTFPSEDMYPTLSGNYALIVYEDADIDKAVAVACFSVVEPKVNIQAKMRADTDIEFSGRYQQLDIDVDMQGTAYSQLEEITLVIEQNGRQDNRVLAPRPTFVEGQRLRWQHCRDLIFEGGNEYQHLDIASVYFMGNNVEHMGFSHADGLYHANLYPSSLRGTANLDNHSQAPYSSDPDADGLFLIHAEKTSDPDIEADYVWVHFQLPASSSLFTGAIYLLGDAWYNRFLPTNRLQYDAELKAFTASCFLKQGGYEWQYAFVPKASSPTTQSSRAIPSVQNQSPAYLEPIEGSHWQTHNTYRIFLYHRPFGGRYQRLIGYREYKF